MWRATPGLIKCCRGEQKRTEKVLNTEIQSQESPI